MLFYYLRLNHNQICIISFIKFIFTSILPNSDMKKIYLLSLVLFLVLKSEGQNIIRCATEEKIAEAIANDPSVGDSIALANTMVIPPLPEVAAVITIPVVVHVIYRTAGQNISTSQILSQITALNRDFRKNNADTTQIPSPFKPLAADTEIEFCLAKRDPFNQPTDGITRTSTTVTNIGSTNFYYKTADGGHDPWPRDRYLNIWVLEIDGSTLGFAYPPGASPDYDGVVIDYRFFGTFGTVSPPFNLGRTGTHEIGHFFNLRHIWGDSNCGNDFVSDTPIQQSANFGCPNFPRRPNSCGTTNPNGDMFMNYMDYVDDDCMVMFTTGQKQRMLAALNSSLGQRSSLKTSDGCIPTGIQERNSITSFKIYPNPASGRFFILLDELTLENIITVVDVTGQVVKTIIADRRTLEVSTTNMAPGIYFIRYNSGTHKLIVN